MSTQPSPESLRRFVREHAADLLTDPNTTSVGIGYKVVDGKETDVVAIQFTVATKVRLEQVADLRSRPIPRTLEVDGVPVPTDVLEREYEPATVVIGSVPEAASDTRRTRKDPVVPGVSIGGVHETAGTLGAVVYDAATGAPMALSSWHVLQGADGKLGEDVLQPGPFDDMHVEKNRLGALTRSFLGREGDCAVSSIEGRKVEPKVLDLGVAPTKVVEPRLKDKLVKSGRTTGVTHGVVSRVGVVVKLDYGDAGMQQIACVEISPAKKGRKRLSDSGDSGSAWLVEGKDGKATTSLAALHVGGEAAGSGGKEHALACPARTVLDTLAVTLIPRKDPEKPVPLPAPSRTSGYDSRFLTTEVPLPALTDAARADAVLLDGSEVVDYTHFSLVMSRSHRLARYVAWNVDGASLKKLPRTNDFRTDPRLPQDAQVDNALYANNRLDRGHLARRADLTWGPMTDARKANSDSFYMTNITPQMDDFNQASKTGVWGRLEDALYDQVTVDRQRITVLGGPVLDDDAKVFRGVKIPTEFWKVIVFEEAGKLQARAFLMTQDISQVESIDTGEFTPYQVSLAVIAERTGLELPGVLERAPQPQGLKAKALRTEADIVW